MDGDRTAAYKVLLSMEEKGSWANLELGDLRYDKRVTSPAFVRALVYGVTESRLLLDYLLDHCIRKGIGSTDPKTKTLLRLGAYQILRMDSVPDYAAVSETVKMARKLTPGRDRFINGVLRTLGRTREEIPMPGREDPVRFLSIRYSCGESLVRLLLGQLGEEKAEAFLAFAETVPPVTVRVNLGKTGRDILAEGLAKKGFSAVPSTLSERCLIVSGEGALTETEEYQAGLFSLQSEESAAIADLADPKPGDLVLDLCAAPGGKTCAMAEKMDGRGRVIASEVYESRVPLIERQAERLQLSIVEAVCRDASVPDPDLAERADLVLADVPCSGWGVLRRKPEIRYRDFGEGCGDLAALQGKILRAAASYVKPGGALVYSTCTVNREENEDVIERFLAEDDRFQIEAQLEHGPHIDGRDGFFAVRMGRR